MWTSNLFLEKDKSEVAKRTDHQNTVTTNSFDLNPLLRNDHFDFIRDACDGLFDHNFDDNNNTNYDRDGNLINDDKNWPLVWWWIRWER